MSGGSYTQHAHAQLMKAFEATVMNFFKVRAPRMVVIKGDALPQGWSVLQWGEAFLSVASKLIDTTNMDVRVSTLFVVQTNRELKILLPTSFLERELRDAKNSKHNNLTSFVNILDMTNRMRTKMATDLNTKLDDFVNAKGGVSAPTVTDGEYSIGMLYQQVFQAQPMGNMRDMVENLSKIITPFNAKFVLSSAYLQLLYCDDTDVVRRYEPTLRRELTSLKNDNTPEMEVAHMSCALHEAQQYNEHVDIMPFLDRLARFCALGVSCTALNAWMRHFYTLVQGHGAMKSMAGKAFLLQQFEHMFEGDDVVFMDVLKHLPVIS